MQANQERDKYREALERRDALRSSLCHSNAKRFACAIGQPRGQLPQAG